MSAKSKTPNPAATSTPAAEPAGSPPAEDDRRPAASAAADETGEAAEDVTPEEIGRALDELSDRHELAGDDDQPGEGEPGGAKPEGEAPAAAAEPGEGDEPAGESGAAAAPPGEGAPEEPGALGEQPEEPETPAEPAEKPETPGAKLNGVQQRINELTAQRKAAEARDQATSEKLARAEERLAAVDAQAAATGDPQALDHIDTPEQLGTYRHNMTALLQKLIRNPEGIELPDPNDKGKTISYDAAGVADLQARCLSILHEAVPDRERFLREREVFDRAAGEAYPWLGNSREGPGAQVHAVILANPAIRRLGPNYRMIAADALVGQTLRQAGVAVTPQLVERLKAEAARRPATPAKPAAAAPAAPRKPPAAPGRPGVLPPRLTAAQARNGAATRALRKGDGNAKDLAASIAELL